MLKHYPPYRQPRRAAGATFVAALSAGLLLAPAASALEVTAGDYEAFPAGSNIAMLYYQYATRGSAYANGNKVSGNFGLDSNVALARYIRVVGLSENLVIDPQFIVPAGRLRTGGDAAALGTASGVGDLIVGAPLKWILDTRTRDVVSVGPYLYAPTGSYDSARALNLGENRWKGLLQVAYIRHFNADWALDLVGDVTVHGKNTAYTATRATLRQERRHEVQAHLRYNLTPATALSAGIGRIGGAENVVDGARQGDRLDTRYARLTVTSFVSPAVQLQLQYGKDLAVDSGPRERQRFNFRVARLF